MLRMSGLPTHRELAVSQSSQRSESPFPKNTDCFLFAGWRTAIEVGKLGRFTMTTNCECKTEITKFRLGSDEHPNRTCALDSVGLFP
jgi:hypothetical protein